MQIVRCQAFASTCAFVWFGSLTATRLPHHSSACQIQRHRQLFHPFFTCYHPRCWHPHRHPHRHCIRQVVLYNFPLSVPLRAALTISSSSSIFSPRLTCIHTAILIDIVLAASCYHLRHRHPHRYRTRRVVLYNFPLSVPSRAALTISRSSSIFSPRLTFIHTAILIDIVLAASYLRSSTPPSSSLTSDSSRLTRWCPCGRHPHWYPLH